MIIQLIGFLGSLIIALAITPKVVSFAKSIGALDYPTERSVHKKAIPRLGGLALILAFGISTIIYVVFKLVTSDINWSQYLLQNKPILGIFIGAFFIFLVGVIDDIYDVSPAFKFAGQTLAALIVISFGVAIEFIGSPWGGLINIPFWIGATLAVFWIIAITNTINFIDGLDGLAPGIGAISGGALYLIAISTGRQDIALILVFLIGSLVGFLRYNFHPAKIFMGDSGSMFLGFLLGAMTLQIIAKSAAIIALLVPIVIMGIPVFDAAYAIWRRFINRRPLTKADKEHIHHVLLHKGLSHKSTVLLIYGWTVILSIVGLTLNFVEISGSGRIIILVLLLPASFFLAYYSGLLDWLFRLRNRKAENGQEN